jgi:hypothetical protein
MTSAWVTSGQAVTGRASSAVVRIPALSSFRWARRCGLATVPKSGLGVTESSPRKDPCLHDRRAGRHSRSRCGAAGLSPGRRTGRLRRRGCLTAHVRRPRVGPMFDLSFLPVAAEDVSCARRTEANDPFRTIRLHVPLFGAW